MQSIYNHVINLYWGSFPHPDYQDYEEEFLISPAISFKYQSTNHKKSKNKNKTNKYYRFLYVKEKQALYQIAMFGLMSKGSDITQLCETFNENP